MASVRESPFYVGGPIPTALAGRYMHGYEEERRALAGELAGRTPRILGILGEPQSGKTSLVLSAAGQLPTPRVHLDCARVWPARATGFLGLLAQALDIKPPVDPAEPAATLARFPVPRKPAKPGLLVLDNADRLTDIHPDLLGALPAFADRLPWHLALTGEQEPLSPYVEDAVTLSPFTEATAADFLRRRFAAARIDLEDDAVPVFHEFARGRPATLQRIGQTVWEQALRDDRDVVAADHVDGALGDLVDRLPTTTVTSWAAVRGHMRDVFVAMCLYDLTSPTEIAHRIGLEPKNVVVHLGRLASVHRLTDRLARGEYHVRDPLLKHHVRKEWGSPILR